MDEIQKYHNNSPVTLRTTADIQAYVQVIHASGQFKEDPAQLVAKVLYGQECGLPPMASARGIYFVNNKPALDGALIASCVKKSGKYNYVVVESDDEKAVVDFYELWGSEWKKMGSETFTIQDAKSAGLFGKDIWKKYTRAMLRWRAISAGARAYCPDATNGNRIYTVEELGGGMDADGYGTGVIEAEIVDYDAPIQRDPVAMPTRKSAPKSKPKPSAGDNIIEGIIEDIEEVSGEKNGEPWTRWGITVAGQKYGTFSETLAEKAYNFKGTGEPVALEFKQNGKFFNAENIIPVGEGS